MDRTSSGIVGKAVLFHDVKMGATGTIFNESATKPAGTLGLVTPRPVA
jgi:hypothetical protein